MTQIGEILYLSRADVEAAAVPLAEIEAAVEASFAARYDSVVSLQGDAALGNGDVKLGLAASGAARGDTMRVRLTRFDLEEGGRSWRLTRPGRSSSGASASRTRWPFSTPPERPASRNASCTPQAVPFSSTSRNTGCMPGSARATASSSSRLAAG